MNRQPRDLDAAIDHVAKRLTHVGADEQFASRLVATLPERRTWFEWLTGSLAPRLAMLALVAGSVTLWSTRHTTDVTSPVSPLTSAANTNWGQLAAAVERDGVTGLVTTAPVARVTRVAVMAPIDRADHEFSLPPVSAPPIVEIATLSAADLSAGETLSVAPLVIDALPLTVETFPERD